MKLVKSKISPVDALRKLIEGNDRFSRGIRSVESFTSIRTVSELSKEGQSPFCMVLACSDSRVPTEVIFDQKMGDLFVIRVAGNVVTPIILGSMEYAARFLGVQLCIVLGHSGCGAVKAAITNKRSPELIDLTSSLRQLIDLISPTLDLSEVDPESTLESAILRNSQLGVNRILSQSKFLSKKWADGKFILVSAVFNISRAKVDFDIPLKLQPLFRLSDPFSVREIPGLKNGES